MASIHTSAVPSSLCLQTSSLSWRLKLENANLKPSVLHSETDRDTHTTHTHHTHTHTHHTHTHHTHTHHTHTHHTHTPHTHTPHTYTPHTPHATLPVTIQTGHSTVSFVCNYLCIILCDILYKTVYCFICKYCNNNTYVLPFNKNASFIQIPVGRLSSVAVESQSD